MLSFSSVKDFYDEDRRKGVYRVQSSRCWYRVAITPDEVTVLGPGVDETYQTDDLPEGFGPEALALCAVLFFEEQET